PNQLAAQTDPIGTDMKSPNTFGALRITTAIAPEDLFAWARTYLKREDGGTYGFARNHVKADRAITAGASGFLFAPPDAAGQRTNAGYYVLTAAKGTVSAVDSDGVMRASKPFAWPAGWHSQYSTVFEALGIDPIPSARIVF